MALFYKKKKKCQLINTEGIIVLIKNLHFTASIKFFIFFQQMNELTAD